MALLLVNMIGYAVGIKGAGRLAGGMFLDREGLLAVAYGFVFFFSGVQASVSFAGRLETITAYVRLWRAPAKVGVDKGLVGAVA